MRFFRGIDATILIALALISTAVRPSTALGDGGTLRAWKQEGRYDIAVFTEPSSLVVGPVDVSVCLLDRTTGETIPEARVIVEVGPPGRPAEFTRQAATHQAATNKLFRAAKFELREPGPCRVNVKIDGPSQHAEIEFEMIVATSWSPQTGIWPWILWPLPVIVLSVIHRQLVERRCR